MQGNDDDDVNFLHAILILFGFIAHHLIKMLNYKAERRVERPCNTQKRLKFFILFFFFKYASHAPIHASHELNKRRVCVAYIYHASHNLTFKRTEPINPFMRRMHPCMRRINRLREQNFPLLHNTSSQNQT